MSEKGVTHNSGKWFAWFAEKSLKKTPVFRIVSVSLLPSRVVFFGPLFEFFDSSIFQGVRILKILAPGQKNFNLLHPGLCWVRSCVPGVPDHLGTPQRSHMGLKLKICYKNDILQAFFVLRKISFFSSFFGLFIIKIGHFLSIFTKTNFTSH